MSDDHPTYVGPPGPIDPAQLTEHDKVLLQLAYALATTSTALHGTTVTLQEVLTELKRMTRDRESA